MEAVEVGGRPARSPAFARVAVVGACFSAVAALAVVAALLWGAAASVRAPALTLGGELPARGRLLWLDGLPTAGAGAEVAARDSAGRVLVVDERLHVRVAALPGDVGAVLSATPAGDGGVWIVSGHGRLLHIGPDGVVASEVATPYRVPALGGGEPHGPLAVTRSVEGFPFALDTLPAPPVTLLDTTGRIEQRLGVAAVPAQPLLADLANAGHVSRVGDLTIFAPFIRDEIVAFDPRGDTAWMVRRGLPQATPDPRFVVRDGRPVLDYFPVNLGVVAGPDGRLYALSTRDSTLTASRLDVIVPTSGAILATFTLPTVFPTIVVSPRGRVYALSSAALLARARDAARPAVPDFAWDTPAGGRVTSADLRGRVTVVNTWASWCAPCREEMPALVGLWRSLADSGLAFLAVNEDVRVGDARRWLVETGLAPPIAFARGAARDVFGYPGLPYTMLIDREGRIARKWIGYLGPEQVHALGEAARRELGLGAPLGSGPSSSAHHAHPGG